MREIFAVSNLFDSPPAGYPPDFHVGFVIERASDVRAAYDRLEAAGIAMKVDFSGGPGAQGQLGRVY